MTMVAARSPRYSGCPGVLGTAQDGPCLKGLARACKGGFIYLFFGLKKINNLMSKGWSHSQGMSLVLGRPEFKTFLHHKLLVGLWGRNLDFLIKQEQNHLPIPLPCLAGEL